MDLDDTLCDYSGVVLQAQEKISSILGLNENESAAFWKHFVLASSVLFEKFSKGEISLEEFRLARFRSSLEQLPKRLTQSSNCEEINSIFVDITSNGVTLYDDSVQFLEYLKNNDIKIVLYTNGPEDTQRRKIRRLGIEHYFVKIYTSQETGIFKPDEKVYLFILKQHDFDKRFTVNIGDSFEFDYSGAVKVGLKTILVSDKIKKSNQYLSYVKNLTTIIQSRLLELL